MWYYNLIPTLKNIHKIIFYIFISLIQENSVKTYKNYKILNGEMKNFQNSYFLNNLQICENRSNNCDCLLLLGKFSFLQIIKNIRYLTRIRIYDSNYFAHFGLVMILKILYYDFTDLNKRTEFTNKSFLNLEMLKKYCLNKGINLLGNNSDYSIKKNKIIESLVIICNDAIHDLHFIKNNHVALAIADPLFFFSETEYSKKYLETLKKFEQNLKFLIIPNYALPVILDLNISTPLILIHSKRFQKEIFIIKFNKFFTKKTHNVFTQFMLPIAMYVDEPIFIGGFSLNNKNIENKLWSYDLNIVTKNSKNFAFNFSFFKDRNFKIYYRKHFQIILNYLNKIENIHEL